MKIEIDRLIFTADTTKKVIMIIDKLSNTKLAEYPLGDLSISLLAKKIRTDLGPMLDITSTELTTILKKITESTDIKVREDVSKSHVAIHTSHTSSIVREKKINKVIIIVSSPEFLAGILSMEQLVIQQNWLGSYQTLGAFFIPIEVNKEISEAQNRRIQELILQNWVINMSPYFKRIRTMWYKGSYAFIFLFNKDTIKQKDVYLTALDEIKQSQWVKEKKKLLPMIVGYIKEEEEGEESINNFYEIYRELEKQVKSYPKLKLSRIILEAQDPLILKKLGYHTFKEILACSKIILL